MCGRCLPASRRSACAHLASSSPPSSVCLRPPASPNASSVVDQRAVPRAWVTTSRPCVREATPCASACSRLPHHAGAVPHRVTRSRRRPPRPVPNFDPWCTRPWHATASDTTPHPRTGAWTQERRERDRQNERDVRLDNELEKERRRGNKKGRKKERIKKGRN
jgi:hypothetical protein